MNKSEMEKLSFFVFVPLNQNGRWLVSTDGFLFLDGEAPKCVMGLD